MSDDTETPLWQVGSGHRPRPRAVPAKCGLCPAPPASALGLCSNCLTAAAAEAARLRPRPTSTSSDGGRLADTPFSAICRRCARPGHQAQNCDA
jgi:hypothetical protein